MHDYFSQSVAAKRLVIEAASLKMAVDPVIIEKDLWVTVTLHALFSNILPSIFVFKGGTSLSKVYGIIERFSEDIDVTIDRSIFGEHLTLQELAELGTNEREKIIEKIKGKAHDYIKGQVIPLLQGSIEGVSREG
jgi:predicted nucleotidyltransferase component of viral defense system